MNGLDIMKKMDEASHGWYRPSPGSIYPLLQQLVNEGLVSKNNDAKFEPTSRYWDESGASTDPAETVTTMSVVYHAWRNFKEKTRHACPRTKAE